MILKLLILTCIIVFVIDLSGIIDEMEKILSKWLKAKILIPKPFSCSLCLTWWIGLLYLLVYGEFNIIWIGYVALLSLLTTTIYNSLLMVRDLLNKIIDWVYKHLIQ